MLVQKRKNLAASKQDTLSRKKARQRSPSLQALMRVMFWRVSPVEVRFLVQRRELALRLWTQEFRDGEGPSLFFLLSFSHTFCSRSRDVPNIFLSLFLISSINVLRYHPLVSCDINLQATRYKAFLALSLMSLPH